MSALLGWHWFMSAAGIGVYQQLALVYVSSITCLPLCAKYKAAGR
jgi:hypothetical protein